MSKEEILNVAEVVGGKPMRQLAEFYVSGSLPDGVNVQAVIDELSKDAELRKELVSMIHAATAGALDGWAKSRFHIASKRLSALREKDFPAFAKVITDAVHEHETVAAAGRALGVSRSQMFRYIHEIRAAGGTVNVSPVEPAAPVAMEGDEK